MNSFIDPRIDTKLTELNETIGKAKGKQELLIKLAADEKVKNIAAIAEIEAIEEAQVLIQYTAKETQEQLTSAIEDIVQLAIEALWPDDVRFKIRFELLRGKTEAKLVLVDKVNNEINPLESEGGGLVDILSFSLRLACWTLSRKDNVIILDEPFKWPSAEFKPLAVNLIKTLSQKLGLQFIIVTHDPEIVGIADKVFHVKKDSAGISTISSARSTTL